MIVAMQVVLPAPLRPSRPSSRPGCSANDDAVQHVAVAVIGVDAARCASASVAKIHLPGARIGDHLGARAFDDDLAVMQHA